MPDVVSRRPAPCISCRDPGSSTRGLDAPARRGYRRIRRVWRLDSGRGLADSILYLVDTISHLREPSHACLPTLDALLTGRARPFTRPGSRSIASLRATVRSGSPRRPGGRRTGDLRVHGGVESDPPYPRTLRRLDRRTGRTPLLMQAGAFGENFSTSGWRSRRLPRRPRAGRHRAAGGVPGAHACWKLNDRFEVAGMSLRVQESGRTGWYYRVLEEGVVAAGDILQLVERRHPDWSLVAPVRGAVRQAGRRRAAARAWRCR